MSDPKSWGAIPVESPSDWGAVAVDENEALRAEMSTLREKDEGSLATKVLGVAENIVRPFANPVGAILKLPEQLAAAVGRPTPYTSEAPLVTPGVALKAVEAVTPGGAASEDSTAKAAQEFVAEMASGMTSPEMAALMLAGSKVPGPVGRYFQAQMLSQVPASIEAIKEAETGKESTKAVLAAAANVAFPALIEGGMRKHAAVEARAKEVGPATAAAVAKAEPAPEPPKPVEQPAVEPLVPRETILEAPKPAEPEPKPIGLGAATPAEFELSPKTATGIKNATVDQERTQRGLPPAMEPARRSFGTVWDSAMAKMDADPGYTDRLTGELRKQPRALTDVEDATLLHRQIELQNEYGKATRDLAQAFDDGRMEDVAAEKVRVAALSDQLLDLYNIDKAAGTETGRGLNARKMMAYEDFSLAKMELEKRAAKDGEQLTDAERAEVVRANKEIEETQKRFDEKAARREDEGRETATEAGVAKAKSAPKPTETQSEIVAALKERFMAGEADAVTSLVQKLARQFVEQGIKERDPLIAAVHDVIKGIDPTLTLRDTMDAISGYGRFKQLSKDEISVKLRDLKGQMQQVAKLEDMQRDKPPLKTGTERRKPSDEERRLIKLVNEAKNKFQIPITDEATQLKSSLDTLKTKLRNQIVDFEARLKAKDFEKKPKRFIQMDAEAHRLHFEAAKAKAKWHEALMKDRLARRPLPQKIVGAFGEVLNTTRAILTSLDLSAVLRQGGFITLGHPIRALKAFPAMIRALKSEAGQHRVNQEIMARKNYPLYQQAKLYLAEHGQKLSQMEEAYMSRWADKIWGVGASQRAYVTFLNRLRADSFDAAVKTLARDAEVTPVEAKAIANFINVATGRGSLGMMEGAGVGMATVFFSPRYVASRFQLIGGGLKVAGDVATGFKFKPESARARKLIAGEYARYLAGVAVVYALGQLAGGEVETDPRSSDFGKLRFGNTRLDPLSGLQQVTVLGSRHGAGETKSIKGDVTPITGEVPYGKRNLFGVTTDFLRTKLAPVPGAYFNLRTGEDVTGRKTPPEVVAKDLVFPLAIKDILKVLEDQGVPRGTALAILSIFGAGVQTYDE